MRKSKSILLVLAGLTLSFALPYNLQSTNLIPTLGTNIKRAKGTQNDPFIVNNYAELKTALTDKNIDYIEINNIDSESDGYKIIDEFFDTNSAFTIENTTKHISLNCVAKFRFTAKGEKVRNFLTVKNSRLFLNGSGTLSVDFINTTKFGLNEEFNLLQILDGCYVTIDDVTLDGSLSDDFRISVNAISCCQSDSNITINSGTFLSYKSKYSMMSSYSMKIFEPRGQITINGGIFDKSDASSHKGNPLSLVGKDRNGNDPDRFAFQHVRLNGGTFRGVYIVPNDSSPKLDFLLDNDHAFYDINAEEYVKIGTLLTHQKIRVDYVKKVEYKISFDANGGTGEMAPVTINNESYTLPDCEFTGPDELVFKGWALNSKDGELYDAGSEVLINGNTRIYAIWGEIEYFTVQYTDRHGKYFTHYAPENYKLNVREYADCFFKEEVGEKFIGWKINTMNGDSISPNAEYVVKDSVLFIATYENVGTVYTLDFDSNGGEGEMGPYKVLENDSFILPDNLFTKDNARFKAWNVGTLGEYAPGQSIKVTENMAVSAVWYMPQSIEIEHSGTLLQGETLFSEFNDLLSIYLVYDDDTKELIDPSLLEYSLAGENEKLDIDTYKFDELGEVELEISYGEVFNVPFRFSFTVVEKYEISYVGYIPEVLEEQVLYKEYVKAGEYKLYPFYLSETPEDYKFLGWSEEANGEVISENKITINSDKTLYSIFESTTSEASITGIDASYSGGDLVKGDNISLKDLSLKVLYSDDSSTDLTLGSEGLEVYINDVKLTSGLDSYIFENEGTYKVSFKYEGFEDSFNIVVKNSGSEEPNPNKDENKEEKKGGLSIGAIIGIIAGSVALLGVGGFLVYWFVFRKNGKTK